VFASHVQQAPRFEYTDFFITPGAFAFLAAIALAKAPTENPHTLE
jgi:hypothetical protein